MVIDLGLAREAPEGRLRDAWRAPRRVRPFALTLCLAVLLLVAGAAAPPEPLLVERASHPLAESADFVVLDDRLYVVGRGDDVGRRALSAYELPSGRLLWTSQYESSVDQVVDLQRGDGVVLVTGLVAGESYGTPTTVLDAATGHPRWIAPVRLTVADDGRTGFVGGATVRALDLTTGRHLWAAAVPHGAAVRAVPGGRALVLTGAGEGQLRDGRTGGVLRSAPMLPAGATPNVATVGDSLVLSYQVPGGGRRVAGYTASGLARRWERPLADDDVSRFGACGRLVCAAGTGGVVAVDPASGDQVWEASGADTVLESGGLLVAATSPGRLATVDPATGRLLVDLSGWDAQLRGRGETVLVSAGGTGEGDRSWLAVAAPGRIRHLGAVPDRLWDCAAGAGSIVCRASGERLRLWAYRM